jgi:hypothetical protein
MTADDILAARAYPAELERLYRADREQFTAVFPAALAREPDSVVLSVWRERLAPGAQTSDDHAPTDWRRLVVALALSLIAGTLVKLPAFFGADDDWFYARFAVPITVTGLIAYFAITHRRSTGLRAGFALASLACFLFLTTLSDRQGSDTGLLSAIHVPLVLWTVLGVAFCGSEWRSVRGRIEYLRYWGEVVVYSSLILLGGIVLTGLTIALFSLIKLDLAKWYRSYVVVYGVVASPIVASYLYDTLQKRKANFAAMLANLFAPLFLLTVVVYLVAMVVLRRSPFSERDFLISLNGLLLLVLAMTILSVAERRSFARPGLVDVTNISLLAVTLLVDTIALAAIVFRLSSMGITPNRLAVFGTNLLVFGHLTGLLRFYVAQVRRRSDAEPMEKWTARYIPLYSIWTAVVAFVFPLLFSFE